MSVAPVKVVVMGVSGAGKSTIGAALAALLGVPFIDGDDLHTAEAVAKMRSGTPLDDADRWPWLDRVGARLTEAARDGGAVIACSALRTVYRDRIRAAAGEGLVFVHLSGRRDLITDRQAARKQHYMPAGLMESQFRTLEEPEGEPDVVSLDVSAAPEVLAERAVAELRKRG